MSEFSSEFRAHLQSGCTTLCHCWRVIRRDGLVLGFTDHDRSLTVDGRVYEPESGFAQTEARATLGMAVDTVDVEGALSSEKLVEDDIALGLFDGATVETLLVNWEDPSQFATLRKASIGKITRADGRFVAELESVTASLDRPNGRILRRECDARLGDGRCKVDVNTSQFRGTGTVVSVASPAIVNVSGIAAYAPGWFAHGEINWTSGRLQGRTSTVASHRAGTGSTELSLPATDAMPSPGDAFTITAGCDKRFETCKAKFANPVNFRGFPHLPGNDAAYGYVADGMVFDGKPLVP